MKYVAKYLPIEGKIKPGEKYLYHGKIIEHNSDYPLTGEKKVKLFLCSRDIQIGNTVTDGGIYHMWKVLEISDNGKQLTLDCSKERWFPPDGLFSVIGEISPDAVFVKEGDEFTDDQIDMRIKNGTYITEVDNLKHIPSEEIKNWSPLALIKCPCCGRFS